MKHVIHTDLAPKAIGPYSQAIRVNDCVYISGQIPLDPKQMTLVPGGIEAEAVQVFQNLQVVAEAAGGNLSNIVKLTIYLMDLQHFAIINEIMTRYFSEPYPARATVQVSALPKSALIEVDALMVLG